VYIAKQVEHRREFDLMAMARSDSPFDVLLVCNSAYPYHAAFFLLYPLPQATAPEDVEQPTN
jgi:hypothetical protein